MEVSLLFVGVAGCVVNQRATHLIGTYGGSDVTPICHQVRLLDEHSIRPYVDSHAVFVFHMNLPRYVITNFEGLLLPVLSAKDEYRRLAQRFYSSRTSSYRGFLAIAQTS